MIRVRQPHVLISTLLTVIIVVLAWWAVVYFAQRFLMYPRPPVSAGSTRPPYAQQVWIPLPQGRVEAWYLPPMNSTGRAAPLLVFTHGNGELIDFWPDAFDEPRTWGMGVLLLEYPGYGRSSGSPSEASITASIEGAYDWALTRPGIDSGRIVAYGRSLGAGAACALAARRHVAALMLESAFTSVRPFARGFAAPGFLVRDPFDNLAVVRTYNGPLLILHGTRDEIVPVRHGQALAAANPHAELHLLPCGHNDCPRPWALIRQFLGDHALLAPRSHTTS